MGFCYKTGSISLGGKFRSSRNVQDFHLDSLLIIHLGGEINEPMHCKDTVYI